MIARLRAAWGGYGSALWVACGIDAVGAIAIALLPADATESTLARTASRRVPLSP